MPFGRKEEIKRIHLLALVLSTSICVLLFLGACRERLETLTATEVDLTFREQYEQSLAIDTLLPMDTKQHWLNQSRVAMEDSTYIHLPYQEQSPSLSLPTAYGLNCSAKMGEQLDIFIEANDTVLVDVWLKKPRWSLLYDAMQYQDTLHIPLNQNGDYLIRVQTLIGATQPFTIQIHKSPQNLMPVVGADNEDVWSRFGDPRDAGKRTHEGVDIFKRRGTPVVASASGTVIEVKEEGLGGKQIWIRDQHLPINHYYAHLHEQYVVLGDFVQKGDTIATVGNTGNAQTTRPHLHYGIYHFTQGAIDPFPFFGYPRSIRQFRTFLDTIPDTWAGPIDFPIRASPSAKASIIHQGEVEHAPLILGWTNHWWHLRLHDGRSGYLWGG